VKSAFTMQSLSAAFCALLAPLPASLGSGPVQVRTGSAHVILISRFGYQPSALTIRAGEAVEWKNEGIVAHTATSVDGKTFDSGQIETGASWRVTLRSKGTFEYICTLHPNMKGRLVVR
jgi:plastocyanin